MRQYTPPILVFAYGNPSRGDDALGPAMYELLEEQQQKAADGYGGNRGVSLGWGE